MSATAAPAPPPGPDPLASALEVTRAPIAWRRVWGTALTSGLAFLPGVLSGHVQWGVWAFLGGFTSFYVSGQPYRVRARVLAAALLGLTAAMVLGSLAVPWWGLAAILGGVSTVATLLAGAHRTPLPAGFMFILVACIGAALPRPAPEPQQALLVAAGGGIGWLIGMSGWVLRPDAPESALVRAAYRALAAYLGHLTDRRALECQNRAAQAVAEAAGACAAGSQRDRAAARRLARLAAGAEELFMAAVALGAEAAGPLPAEWRRYVAAIGDAAQPPPAPGTPAGARAEARFQRAALRVAATRLQERGHVGHRAPGRSVGGAPSARGVLGASPLLPESSLRIGIAVAASVVIAHLLGASRPYWVPLTCAAVLQGETVLMLTKRAIQRVVGTTAGLLVAGALIIGLHTGPLPAAALIVGLQALLVMTIARNYAVAVAFMTAFALLILHISTPAPALALVRDRFGDTLLGVAVAVAATFLLWPRASSRGLPAAVSRLIGRVAQVFSQLADRTGTAAELAELQAEILRTDALSRDAQAEWPPAGLAAALAPAVGAAARLGYLLLAAGSVGQDLQVADDAAARVRGLLQALAHRIAGDRAGPCPPLDIPAVWPPLAGALRALAGAAGPDPAA